MTGQISFDCPACSADRGMPNGDGRGNLEINYELGVFKCWSCMDTNHMSGSVTKLLSKYGSKQNVRDYKLIRPDDFTPRDKDKLKLQAVLPEGYKELSKCTGKEFKYGEAIRYLRRRGITDSIIERYKIGYTISGQFFNRVIIPSYDKEGVLNYFIARWFDSKYTKIKYLNPEVEKQEIIFNEALINWDATIYLVEGATDHIVTPNSIPLLGKFIADKLLEAIFDNAMANVVIVLDGDAYADALILYRKLNIGRLHGKIKMCKPKEDMDPSKVNEVYGKVGIINMLRSARKLKEHELY